MKVNIYIICPQPQPLIGRDICDFSAIAKRNYQKLDTKQVLKVFYKVYFVRLNWPSYWR